MDFNSPEFWIALGQIIMIDILLGGDNAVVIALASRRLPDAQRKQAIFWGMFGAVALRVGQATRSQGDDDRVISAEEDIDHDDLAEGDPEFG